jgi:hypothetical protein
MRISNSFSEDEVQVLDFITQTLLRGGDPRIATRNKAFGSVCRKVLAMKSKVNELKQRADRQDSSVADRQESSVGTVASPAHSAAGATRDEGDAAEAHAHDDIATAV